MQLPKIIRRFFAPLNGVAAGWNAWRNPTDNLANLRRYQGYVYACVSAIAEDVAMIDFEVYSKLQDGTLKELENHSLLSVLDNPNPLMSKYQLIEMTSTHIELTGEAFWYSELGEQTQKPKSFYLLPPDRMQVAIDKDASLPRIAGYVYLREDGTRVPLDPLEVTHFKMPNPWDPYRGYGTVEAALLYIQTERYGAEYTRNYIYNNAMPAGIVSIKGSIDVDQFNQVKAQWKQEYGTIDKAGKTAFIKDADIDFKQIGTSLADSALKEIKDMSRDDIMTMFRVSKPILGIFEDVNLASAKTAQYVFMSRVIDPKMARLVDTLQFVLDRWNTNNIKYVLGYESPVPEDIDDKIKVYQAGLNNWLTVNEIRAYEGMESVDGGDVLREPLNLVPIGNAPTNGTKSVKSGKSIIKRTVLKTVTKIKDLDYQRKESFRQELMANQEQWSNRFKKEVDKLLNKQLKRILENIKTERTTKTVKAFDEFKFDDGEAQADFVGALTPLEFQLADEQGSMALSFLGENELPFQITDRVRNEIARRIARMAKNFNEETKANLVKTLTEAHANNESFADIKKRIESVYEEAKGYRAERIARTETLNASNAAAKEAYQQTGYVTKIEWFANPGACEFCVSMDGTVVGVEDDFVPLGGEVVGQNSDGDITDNSYQNNYDNVDAPPLHPNCTCTLLPVRD